MTQSRLHILPDLLSLVWSNSISLIVTQSQDSHCLSLSFTLLDYREFFLDDNDEDPATFQACIMGTKPK